MKIVFVLLALALLILVVVFAVAAGRVDRTTVLSLDIERYMGTWYEIARYDHSFERWQTDVSARDTLEPDGRIEVENRGVDIRNGKVRIARGKAHASRTPGRLRVSFFWIFYSDYNVLELADDYSWAQVGGRSARYLWILARTPELPAATLDHILRLAEKRGYDTTRLLFTGKSERKTS